ncbi:MAG: hypothetical protein V4694_01595 [Pseudomonadota bacterium]
MKRIRTVKDNIHDINTVIKNVETPSTVRSEESEKSPAFEGTATSLSVDFAEVEELRDSLASTVIEDLDFAVTNNDSKKRKIVSKEKGEEKNMSPSNNVRILPTTRSFFRTNIGAERG